MQMARRMEAQHILLQQGSTLLRSYFTELEFTIPTGEMARQTCCCTKQVTKALAAVAAAAK